MRRFENKVAFVTGAGSGIGRACALGFAREGAGVAVVDIVEDRAKATVESIIAGGGAAIAITADVSKPDQVQEAVQKTVSGFGQLNILINNVGLALRKKFIDYSIEEWNHMINVCLNGYFLCIKFSLPEMIKAGGGKIVSISSICGHIGYGGSAYTAAKGGILALTRELAMEFAPYRININTVSPGVVETGINVDTLSQPDIRNQMIALTPWGRLGVPDDISGAVMYLASPEADYVTGAGLIVDGAMSSTMAWGSIGEKLNSFHAQK